MHNLTINLKKATKWDSTAFWCVGVCVLVPSTKICILLEKCRHLEGARNGLFEGLGLGLGQGVGYTGWG